MPAPERATTRPGDRALLIAATREAGAIALSHFRNHPKQWDKGGGQGPVSEADLAVDAHLRERILAERPEDGWLSEETTDDLARLEKRRVWVVDPIDGTRAFLRGEPWFAVSVALVEAGRPVLGAVFNPAQDVFYEAALGEGARANDAPLHASARAELSGAKILGVEGFLRSRRWAEPWPADCEIGFFNSIALRLCLVAQGAWDACVAMAPKHDWDLAAAELIAAEAGARVSDPKGREFRYNGLSPRQTGVLAAAPALHEEIVARAGGLGPKQ